MIVSELIAILAKVDPTFPVVICDDNACGQITDLDLTSVEPGLLEKVYGVSSLTDKDDLEPNEPYTPNALVITLY